MMNANTFFVGEVADLCGISVRQLHHWDAIGLVPASKRSSSGYRLYSTEDIERLQSALVYRETGMSLLRIKDTLDSDDNPHEHIRNQLKLLLEQRDQVNTKIKAVKKLLEITMQKTPVSIEEKAQILGQDWTPEWDDEACSRWGHTEAWQISAHQQSAMTGTDWPHFKEVLDDIAQKMGHALQDGVLPDSTEAQRLVEEHRAALSTLYPVSHAQHVLLGKLYKSDERFANFYNSRHYGLTDWLVQAINTTACAHGVDPQTATWE